MMTEESFIHYKNKEILFTCYTEYKTDEKIIKALRHNRHFITTCGKTGILLLEDIRGTYVKDESMKELQVYMKEITPFLSKYAIIGVTGVKKLILKILSKFSRVEIKPMDSIEEAKEWLVQE
jgi:hypothetical protein